MSNEQKFFGGDIVERTSKFMDENPSSTNMQVTVISPMCKNYMMWVKTERGAKEYRQIETMQLVSRRGFAVGDVVITPYLGAAVLKKHNDSGNSCTVEVGPGYQMVVLYSSISKADGAYVAKEVKDECISLSGAFNYRHWGDSSFNEALKSCLTHKVKINIPGETPEPRLAKDVYEELVNKLCEYNALVGCVDDAPQFKLVTK